MRRTTIYLDAEQEVKLKLQTQRQGRPMAELIREAIGQYLASSPSAERVPGWGRLKSGFSDTADRFEELLTETGFGERASGSTKPAAARRTLGKRR